MKRIIVFSIINFLLCTKTIGQESFVINADKANIRKTPSKNGQLLGYIERGEVVTVIDFYSNEWYKISYFGNEGYISSKLLVSIENSPKYKDWKKTTIITGDNPECENLNPQYDTSLTTELIIDVGNNADAMVKLMTQDDVCIRLVYIKSGETYTIKNIPENYYYLKVAYGKEMRKKIVDNQCIVRFLVNPTYKKGNEILDYYKKRLPDTIEDGYVYKNWEVPSYKLSLNVEYSPTAFKKTKRNTLIASKISEEEFNK